MFSSTIQSLNSYRNIPQPLKSVVENKSIEKKEVKLTLDLQSAERLRDIVENEPSPTSIEKQTKEEDDITNSILISLRSQVSNMQKELSLAKSQLSETNTTLSNDQREFTGVIASLSEEIKIERLKKEDLKVRILKLEAIIKDYQAKCCMYENEIKKGNDTLNQKEREMIMVKDKVLILEQDSLQLHKLQQIYNDLSYTCDEGKVREQRLQEEIDDLMKTKDHLTNEVDRYRNEQLQNEILVKLKQSVSSKVEELKTIKITLSEKEICLLKSKLAAELAVRYINILEGKIDLLNEKGDHQDSKIKSFLLELDAIETQKNDACMSNASLTSRVYEFERKINDKELVIRQMSKDISKYKTKNETQESKNIQLKNIAGSLLEKKKTFTRENKKLKDTLKLLEKNINAFEKETMKNEDSFEIVPKNDSNYQMSSAIIDNVILESLKEWVLNYIIEPNSMEANEVPPFVTPQTKNALQHFIATHLTLKNNVKIKATSLDNNVAISNVIASNNNTASTINSTIVPTNMNIPPLEINEDMFDEEYISPISMHRDNNENNALITPCSSIVYHTPLMSPAHSLSSSLSSSPVKKPHSAENYSNSLPSRFF